jgi:uncharacterized protein YgbK (DUF1537 family)
VLEALALGGVETVLFVEPPTDDMWRRYPLARAIGVAGNSRTMSPDEMDAALPAAFAALLDQQPKFVHYKVCSTFDSSPTIGSIGRAIDVGQRVFQNRFVPLVVGAPALHRFCVFGNQFARSGLDSEIYRLDRHPTMRHHPVTPMAEADLRLHLAAQTDRPVALVDAAALEEGYDAAAAQLARAIQQSGDGGIVLFDTLTDAHLATIGRLIAAAQEQEQKPLFVAGSSGVEYALSKHWQVNHAHTAGPREHATPADRVLVASGSCSPVTERQIAWALAHGFAELPLDTPQLLAADDVAAEVARIANEAAAELDAGRSVIVHSCRGPADPRKGAAAATFGPAATARRLGVILGQIVGRVLDRSDVRRLAVTGGDTSGHVARTLGIEALEMIAPLEPGAPLCKASRSRNLPPIEITFKGGQVGHDDFFGTVLRGRRDR